MSDQFSNQLKQTLDLAQKLSISVDTRIGQMKDADVLKKKLTSARNNLMKANEPQFLGTLAHSKSAFLEIIKDFHDILSRIDYQTNKYATSNAVKKKIHESDVRNKLRELAFNLSNLDRMIESVFLVNLQYYQNHNIQQNQQVAVSEERKESQGHLQQLPLQIFAPPHIQFQQQNQQQDMELYRRLQDLERKIDESNKKSMTGEDFGGHLKKHKTLRTTTHTRHYPERQTTLNAKKNDPVEPGISHNPPSKRGNQTNANAQVETQAEVTTIMEGNNGINGSNNNFIQAENYCFEADSLFFVSRNNSQSVQQAVDLYVKSADLGNPKAMMALGRIYEVGVADIKPNPIISFEYYERASAYNLPYALYQMGLSYEYKKHQNIPNHIQVAMKFYRKAVSLAEKQDPSEPCNEALYKVAYFYQNGIEVEKNLQKAIDFYQEAAYNKHEKSMNALGSLFYNELKEYSQAAEWFRNAASHGCPRALNNLGICYEFGHGIEVDMDQAFQQYKQSSDKGFIPAKYNLACMYLLKARNSNLKEHYKEAANLFMQVLAKDDSKIEAYFYLGQFFEQGLGVDQDFSTAFRYYKIAAAKNFAKAHTKCGDLLYSGKGRGCDRRDKNEAFKCYQRAAALGDSEALNNLGLMIENGFDDRPSDPEGALEIYRQAHKLGNADALINIALYYIRGKQPVETDTKKGKEILKQAYKIGSTVSKDTVLDYMIGFGFIKNKKEMEIEMLNMDEEVVSWMAQSSTGFNNIPTTSKRTNQIDGVAPPSSNKETGNAFNSANWGRTEDGGPGGNVGQGQRSSLHSVATNSMKFTGGGATSSYAASNNQQVHSNTKHHF